jgi:hypothetical protein
MLAAVGLVVGDDHSEMASGLIDLVADVTRLGAQRSDEALYGV